MKYGPPFFVNCVMELNRRKLILHKYLENPTWSNTLIGKSLQIPKGTVRDVLARYKETLTVERAKGFGRKKGPVNPKLTKKLVKSAVKYPNMLLRDRAMKLGIFHTGVKLSFTREGYRSFSVIKSPNRNEKAATSANYRIRKLYDNVLKNYDANYDDGAFSWMMRHTNV